jgi:acyl-CoA synthetase (AMP-forming)/AMP-acid ligase II
MLPGGWLRTGDGGSFDPDGFLYLHDRLKDMLISGGENVYPAEVESVMTGHPAVAEVAVIGVRSDRWGESPYAVVVLRPGGAVTEAELIDWTRERLAHFKCPVGVSFVPELARTASGKLRKHAIREALGDNHIQDPDVERTVVSPSRATVSPLSPGARTSGRPSR